MNSRFIKTNCVDIEFEVNQIEIENIHVELRRADKEEGIEGCIIYWVEELRFDANVINIWGMSNIITGNL
jgi:hypothetical protein